MDNQKIHLDSLSTITDCIFSTWDSEIKESVNFGDGIYIRGAELIRKKAIIKIASVLNDSLQEKITPNTAIFQITNIIQLMIEDDSISELTDDKFSRLLSELKVSLQPQSQKIENWVNENIPNSPNKKGYIDAFKVICDHPNPKSVTHQELIREIHSTHPDLPIGEEMLRKRIPNFLNAIPL
jgi:hypothetical protein